MPRNGSGTYAPPAGQPVISGTTVLASTFNTLISDVGTEITRSVSTDGQTPMLASLSMGANKIVNLGAATLPSDAPRFDQVTVKANSSDLAATSGSGLVGFAQQGTGAQPRDVQSVLREMRTNVFNFMTDAQRSDVNNNIGSVGVGAAIQAAIDATAGLVRLPVGTYKIDQQIIIRGACTGLVGEGMYTTTLQKAFNGDLISSTANGVHICDFAIEGNGATYSGGGIVPKGYDTVIARMHINGTADSPVLMNAAIGSNASAATYLKVHDCFLLPYDVTATFAIRSIGVDDSTRPTCRTFTKISGGGPLVDFSGMNYVTLSDSLGTSVKFSSTSGKIHMRDNRLTCQSNITIYGVDHIIDNNSWGFGAGFALYMDATAANVNFGAGNSISINGSFGQAIKLGTTIGAGNPNFVYSELTSFPFGWYGSTSNAVLGNATATAYYKLSGSLCFTTLNLIVGSTTNVAVGTYTFQLPFKAYVTANGSALVKSSSGTYYEATFIVQGSSSVGVVYLVPAATNAWDSTMIAFGTNATFNMTIVYMVATS